MKEPGYYIYYGAGHWCW